MSDLINGLLVLLAALLALISIPIDIAHAIQQAFSWAF